ncbi:SUMO-conjugating enzyme UBC9-A [Thelohanellus kitauei]|uniref:SUMO-conjugating enzyme UBC9-A n=1 Tax=Thelohanellus kitauei TaxID=669202 RepID=A0A0C2ID39_THEKT|nr:SUMO-conjugating enzyme UBC9-A [Thelohanellus kitauei]
MHQTFNRGRKSWLSDHPHGFVAKPVKNTNGTLDLKHWTCLIPGPEKTIWEGGFYKLDMKFNDTYPSVPPICAFTPPIFHPNVFPNGSICLSTLRAGHHWKPSITIKQLLLGIQAMLNEPNNSSPANGEAQHLYKTNKEKYDKKVREMAKKFNNCVL